MASEKKKVSIDVNEFVRTRDALTSAYLSLSTSLDTAVKAYIAHTEVVLKGDASLDVSHLLKPFSDVAAPQLAQLALAYQSNGGSAQTPAPVVEVNGKKKRTYKPRDPNAPKRPLTAYFRFLQETRGPLAEQMAKSDPGASKPGDLTKLATERWKNMSAEEQQPYKEAYQRALKDYEREVVSYKATEADGVEEAHEEEDEPQIEAAAVKAADSETSSESSSEDSEEEKAAMPPPPPPKAPSPEPKKTPKNSRKKKDKADEPMPTPQFSSINPTVPVASPKTSSPDLKRKAPADTVEESGKKKRGRKSKAEKEAIEAAAAAAAAAQAAAPSSDASADKPKKDKKKKRKSEA